MAVRLRRRASLPKVVVSTAGRERFLRRIATVVTAFSALIALLVVSVVSVALGLITGEPS
jgi:hypothetical protein